MIGKKRFLRRSVKMAKEAGYHNAKYAGVWEGRYVYKPVFSDEDRFRLRINRFMIVEGESMRWDRSVEEKNALAQLL